MASKRLMALDVFRGMTIALMITVNNPGSWSYIYAPFRHARWHGCTPTDLVFPFFLFIVGVAMWFAFKKFDYKLTSQSSIKLAKRTILIFAVGLLLNAFPYITTDYSKLRIMGVLQRIALAYGFAGLICLSVNKKYLKYISVLILIGYWLLLKYLGGDAPYSLKGNVNVVFDTWVFGSSHLWHGYGIAFDPEGLLGVIPSVVTVILGYLTGSLIHNTTIKRLLFVKMMIFGVVGVIAGEVFDLVFPINKALWTSSYVLYTSSLAIMVIAFSIWLIDIKEKKKWSTPLLAFGMNPLFIFVFAGVWARIMYMIKVNLNGESVSLKHYIYSEILTPIFGNYTGSLVYALVHIIIFWVLVHIMYKRKIFVKI